MSSSYRLPPTVLAVVAVCAALAFARPAPAQDTGLFLNILPPGQSGYMTLPEAIEFLSDGTLPAHFDDQRLMYGDLTKAPPGLTDADLLTYFKPAPIAPSANPPDSIEPPLEKPTAITITRDDFGVPHVVGKGRSNLFFGIGYATARDRLFQMDVLRRIGRGQLSKFLGVDPGLVDFALNFDESLYQFAGYSADDLRQAIDGTIARLKGKAKKVLLKEIEPFLDGVNLFVSHANSSPLTVAPAEHVGLGLLPIEEFTIEDVLWTATVLVESFGAGGGSEHRNANLLQKLKGAYGDADGEALFEDLRHAEEPEAPVSTSLEFPYMLTGSVDPAAVALPDVDSVVQTPIVQITGSLPPAAVVASASERVEAADRPRNPAASNFLGIAGEHAAAGHPIAVMGPQAGYLIPATFVEASFSGSGMMARGSLVPGTPYVVLGRGANFAFSATAGGSDTTDVRVEKLCEPDASPPSLMSQHYVFNAECTPMFVREDTWCIGDAAFCAVEGDNVTATVERTVHGIVFARATVAGEPVALARQRASFLREADLAVAFSRVNKKSAGKFKKFVKAMESSTASFNWLYVNQDEMGYLHTGVFPIRADGVDPDLPSWGTGEWEWQGELGADAKPQQVDPPSGVFTSWNNKPARAWRASDSQYGYSTLYRVDMLDDRIEAAVAAGSPITVAQMVGIMEDAGTTDLRGSHVLPHALAIIGSEAGLGSVLAILGDWVESGAFRRDREGDGEYDHSSAVAIMDAWFEPFMIDAVFGDQLGAFYGDIPLGFDNEPNAAGSAYQSGYYGMLEKVFRMAQGLPVTAPYQVLRCTDGTLAACRAALVASLSDAVAALTAQFASADPADWRVDPTSEDIEFSPLGLATVDPMPWVNRPTFQQVVQVLSKKPVN